MLPGDRKSLNKSLWKHVGTSRYLRTSQATPENWSQQTFAPNVNRLLIKSDASVWSALLWIPLQGNLFKLFGRLQTALAVISCCLNCSVTRERRVMWEHPGCGWERLSIPPTCLFPRFEVNLVPSLNSMLTKYCFH